MRARTGRQQDAAPETHFPRRAHLLHRLFDVVDVDDGDARVAFGARLAEISEPAVVGAAAGEVLLGRDRIAVLHQPCAEGRHLGKDDLPRDAVVVELLGADGRIELPAPGREGARLVREHAHHVVVAEPYARIRHRPHSLAALARLLGVRSHRFLIEEGPGPGHHLAGVGEPPGIGRFPVLARQVLVVGRGQRPCVAIRTDDHDLGHGLPRTCPSPAQPRADGVP